MWPPTDGRTPFRDETRVMTLSERIDVDLRLAVNLLATGCPDGTAFRILL